MSSFLSTQFDCSEVPPCFLKFHVHFSVKLCEFLLRYGPYRQLRSHEFLRKSSKLPAHGLVAQERVGKNNEELIVAHPFKKFHAIYEARSFINLSKKHTVGPYPEPVECSRYVYALLSLLRLGLPSDFFPSKMYAFLIVTMRATSPQI